MIAAVYANNMRNEDNILKQQTEITICTIYTLA